MYMSLANPIAGRGVGYRPGLVLAVGADPAEGPTRQAWAEDRLGVGPAVETAQ